MEAYQINFIPFTASTLRRKDASEHGFFEENPARQLLTGHLIKLVVLTFIQDGLIPHLELVSPGL